MQVLTRDIVQQNLSGFLDSLVFLPNRRSVLTPQNCVRWRDCTLLCVPPGRFGTPICVAKSTIAIALGPSSAALGVSREFPAMQDLTTDDTAILSAGVKGPLEFDSHAPTIILEVGERTLSEWQGLAGLNAEDAPLMDGTFNDSIMGYYGRILLHHIATASERAFALDDLSLQAIMLGIGTRLMAQISQTGTSAPRPARVNTNRIAEAKVYIDQNLSDRDLCVESISSAIGLSAPRFTDLFKEHEGETPYAYVLRQRTKRAHLLICETARPFAIIAFECGFSSAAHLSTVVKRQFGASPKAIRNR